MKKYLLCVLMAVAMCFNVGCGSTEAEEPAENQQEEVVENEQEEAANSQTKDGVTITVISAVAEAYTGDDKYDQKILMQYEIKNGTDAAFGYMNGAWTAKLADGFKLETFVTMEEMDLNQVPSQSTKEVAATFLVEKGVAVEQFTAEYSFFDYDEEYWQDLGKAMTGELSQDEYMAKYGDIENNVMAFDVIVE